MGQLIHQMLAAAAKVSSGWSLAAFAMAVVFGLLAKRRSTALAVAGVIAIVLLGALPIVAQYLVQSGANRQIYRVRATILGPSRVPVEDVKVWSEVGGEAKQVGGGWEFDVPAASLPAGRRMTIHAEKASAFLIGEADVLLDKDFNPAVQVQLKRPASAMLRGAVIDRAGRAAPNVSVSVSGFPGEAAQTDTHGNFALQTHAAEGEQVMVHIEPKRGRAVNQYMMAGDVTAQVVLP